MTYNVFGGMLSLTESIIHRNNDKLFQSAIIHYQFPLHSCRMFLSDFDCSTFSRTQVIAQMILGYFLY